MSDFSRSVEQWLDAASGFIWGPAFLTPLLAAVGLYLTWLLRGIQFTQLGHSLWFALVVRKERTAQGDISHFQSLMTALAATVGTGNIAGVATAIAAGGPGALFWMWMTGLVGMATKYAEGLLSVRYREVDDRGHMSGGPMYFLARGIPRVGVPLGAAYALFAAVAAFGIGNGVQGQAVGNALHDSFGWSPRLVQGVMAVGVAGVTLGGIRSLGRVAGVLVPIMLVGYLVAAVVVLILNVAYIPQALAAVFVGAFGGDALGGGLAGAGVAAAIRFGVARGIFSNESGLGSAGIAAAAAETREPARQALVSMTQTFIDTLVICTLTGLVILTTAVQDPSQLAGTDGSAMTATAFEISLPGTFGSALVALGLSVFAFTTVLGWSYYGEKSLQFLLGTRAVVPYRVVFAAMVVIGPWFLGRAIWLFSDVMNGLMALPNLIGLVLLSGVVVAETRSFVERRGHA